MWYPFCCSICQKRVPDHWTPECGICEFTQHILCDDHHEMLVKAGIIEGFKRIYEGGNWVDTRHGIIKACPTPELLLSLRLMERV